MKIIISPAKSLDFETQLPIKNFSVPDFLTESKIINQLLKKKSPSQLKSLMSHYCMNYRDDSYNTHRFLIYSQEQFYF